MSGLACLLLASLCGFGCSFDYGDQAPPDYEGPAAVFTDYARRSVNSMGTTFEATAEKAEYYDSEKKIELYGVAFSEFDPADGRLRTQGQTDKIVYRSDSGDAEASGFVSIWSADEDVRFETDYLRYSGATKSVEGSTEHRVLVKIGDGSWIRGAGFYGDSQQRSFTLRDGVEGWIAGDTSPGSEE